MRCEICDNFEDCETLRELKYIIDKMEIHYRMWNSTESLHEDLYILIAKFCRRYIEKQGWEV